MDSNTAENSKGPKGAKGPMCGSELQIIDYISAELKRYEECEISRDSDGNTFCGPIDYWVLVQAETLLKHYKELYTKQLEQAGLYP